MQQSPGFLDVDVPDDAATLQQTPDEARAAQERSRGDAHPPARVPGYCVLRRIGEGAYGSVWLAREENTGKFVAIKFYTHRRGLDWSLLNREVEKLAALYTSRNIVRLIDVGWNADPPHYVMEYLENGSLDALLASGPMPVHEAVRIARGVLRALVHAHDSGILHCDLKPANVLLDAETEPRLCDFGQSRLSHEQKPALGTLFYMAPEQADRTAIPDARWDVYALGALLYHMLVGEPPHRTETNLARLHAADDLDGKLAEYRHLLRDSPRPDRHRHVAHVDRPLAEIVDRCLRPDPVRRYSDAQAVLDALDARDRRRARRPLFVLGILGPILLLLATVPFIVRAMHGAVATAAENLTDRALESDLLTARILARSLERELDDRRAELARIAENPNLRASILEAAGKTWEERQAVFARLARYKKAVDDERDASIRPPDASWFVTDREGHQIWRHPFDAKTIDHDFSWRDYYHGRGVEYDPEEVPPDIGPIREPHISHAFRSDATLQYMVSISVPVWDEAREQVIGILARTTHLGQLVADYERRLQGQGTGGVDRVVALVDQRNWEVLDHPWLKSRTLSRTDEPLLLPADLRAELSGAADGRRDAAYVDPVSRVAPEYSGLWLAAFATVGQTGWTAIVQERRDAALQPVDDMRANLTRYAVWAGVVGCAFISLLWYVVLHRLRDRGPMSRRKPVEPRAAAI